MKTGKATWTRPAYQVTSTGFEVTMYLGTESEVRK
jgi:coenzyme PQQ precursor peptide PqqA